VHKTFEWALEQHASVLNAKSSPVPAAYLDAVDAPLGQRPPARLEIDDCPPRPVPAGDWYGAMLNPEQVSRNPAFLVDGYVNLPESERIRATLAAAAPMNEPRTLARTNLEHRQGGIAKGPPGHDGWKYTFSPWEGAFTMGSAGLRAWADLVASMDQPSDNFELVHGIDTTFGGMLSFRARTVVAWLRWAEPRVSPAARQGLARARAAFTEIARVNNEALGLVRTVPCYIDAPPPERTRADLEAMIAGQPALLYMITGEERALLGARAEASRGSPWGYRLLPGREAFEAARAAVPARLRRLAEVREDGFAALEAAARRM